MHLCSKGVVSAATADDANSLIDVAIDISNPGERFPIDVVVLGNNFRDENEVPVDRNEILDHMIKTGVLRLGTVLVNLSDENLPEQEGLKGARIAHVPKNNVRSLPNLLRTLGV